MSDKIKYKRKTLLAIFIEMAAFALLIAALNTPYFTYMQQYQIAVPTSNIPGVVQVIDPIVNTSSFFFRVDALEQDISTPTTQQTIRINWSDRPAENVVFQLIFAGNLIGVINSGVMIIILCLLFVDNIRNKTMYNVGVTKLKVALIVIVLIQLLACVLAFLALLGVTSSLSSDMNGRCQGEVCARFSDSNSHDAGLYTDSKGATYPMQYKEKWGPDSAWFIVLSCVPLSIFVAILLVLSKLPIPTDDVTMDPV